MYILYIYCSRITFTVATVEPIPWLQNLMQINSWQSKICGFKRFNFFTRELVTFAELILVDIKQVHEITWMKKKFIMCPCFESVIEEKPQISLKLRLHEVVWFQSSCLCQCTYAV